MAKNLELRENIAGDFNNTNSLIYIRTHIDQVDGLLDSNDKFSLGLIPSALLETKKLSGVITADISLDDALDLIAVYHDNETTLYPGSYLISQGKRVISNYANHIIQYSDDGLPAGDSVTLENGDHLFYIKQGTAYVWGEVAIDVYDTVGKNIFGSIAEMSEVVPTAANVSAVVTGYRWAKTDQADYDSSANKVQKVINIGGGSLPDKYDAASVWMGTNSRWTTNNGDYCMRLEDNDGVTSYGYTYWRLEEVVPGGYPDNLFGSGEVAHYKSEANASQHIWGVVNVSYDIATEEAQGLMSAGMVKKLNGIEAGANKYIHATDGANTTITAGGLEKLASITVNSLGHVTAVSKEDIQTGSTSQKGVVQLADVSLEADWKTAQSATKPAAPNVVKTMINYFAGLKIYNGISTDAATANAAHAEGALALFLTE